VARAAVRRRLTGPLPWRVATLLDTRDETATARTLVLHVDGWPGHLPGQHVDLRLTAGDGYSTQRSYSIASAPDADTVELTVQMLPDGEVSPFLVRDYAIGDPIELRGPIGGWFVWHPEEARPALLIAGGSGVVPLMAMLRTHRAVSNASPLQLVYSVRTPDDVLFADELKPSNDEDITILYTRTTPDQWPRPPRRLHRDDLAPPGAVPPAVYVCGPTGFVESAAGLLVDVGHEAGDIRTERFGPSGA
jgi:ferredoxin-NADP reductase